MKKNELVTLRPNITSAIFYGISFKPNQFYRCEPEGQGYLIFGTYITKMEHKAFETAHERVMRDWKELGLLTSNGKAISKTAFKKLADIHTYGTGYGALKVWYFRNTRERIYAFYPSGGQTAKAQAYETYEYYLALIAGEMDPLDNEDVMFGNCGIPLNYRGLSVR